VKSSPQKRGGYGSTELAIVVARRSWLEISLWQTGKDRKKEKEHTRKKEKEHTRKKREDIRTAELNRRDQVTAPNSWASSLRKEGNRGRLSGSSTY
jgi:hypothetical protein